LYDHSRQVVAESGYPVLEVTTEKQRGDAFGERLANAFADAFAQGYERVIAVGNDCPRLHEVDWADVSDRLATGTPVLGPTADGDGTYLIGLTRAHFDRDAFAALPWQTPTLLAALHAHLARDVDPVLLAPRRDINTERDLVSFLRRSSSRGTRRLRAALRAVLGANPQEAAPSPPLSSGRAAQFCRSRAPPSLCTP
jgi:glycosyltransferase A (GT-A) superfamily protein (DUF2064 family)